MQTDSCMTGMIVFRIDGDFIVHVRKALQFNLRQSAMKFGICIISVKPSLFKPLVGFFLTYLAYRKYLETPGVVNQPVGQQTKLPLAVVLDSCTSVLIMAATTDYSLWFERIAQGASDLA